MDALTNKIRYFRRRLLGMIGLPVYPEPGSIDVEPTVRCNLKCVFCQHSIKRRQVPDMPLELFRKVLNGFPDLRSVKLQGIGEPLLHPQIFQMIHIAKQRNIRVSTYTNGTLLSSSNIKKLLETNIDEVYVSIDHCDAQIMEAIRPGLNFQPFIAGVEQFNKLALSTDTQTIAWTVVTQALGGNVMRHIAHAKKMGFKHLIFQLDMTRWGGNAPLQSAAVPSQEVIAEVQQAAERFRDGIIVETVHTNSFSPEKPCPWPFYHCFISADGHVQPCCIITDPKQFTLGNLLQKSFYRIWNGSRYFRFRCSFSKGALHDFCLGCYRKAGEALAD